MRMTAVLLLLLACSVHAQFPPTAGEFKRLITDETFMVWGPGGAPATVASIIHQESHWRPEVCSWAGACGLGQFMPGTVDDVTSRYPELWPAQPLDPEWSIRATVRYLKDCWNWAEMDRFGGPWFTEYDHRDGMASCYNGGIGWLVRDRRLCDDGYLCFSDMWRAHVEVFSSRSESAFEENRHYVRRTCEIEPLYATWGRGLCFH